MKRTLIALVAAGIVPAPSDLQRVWEMKVRDHLNGSGLCAPAYAVAVPTTRAQQTEHRAPLLAELQSVARLEVPGTKW